MKKLALVLSIAAALSVSAETKIATVNMMDLVRLHPNHASNKQLIVSTQKDYKDKMDVKQDAVKAIAEEGRKAQEEAQNPMLSVAAKQGVMKKMEDIQRRFMGAQQELRQDAQRYESELADLEQRLIKLETDDLRAKISAWAKENGYDLIVDSSMAAYASSALDVTDAILKKMNIDPALRNASKDEAKSEAK